MGNKARTGPRSVPLKNWHGQLWSLEVAPMKNWHGQLGSSEVAPFCRRFWCTFREKVLEVGGKGVVKCTGCRADFCRRAGCRFFCARHRRQAIWAVWSAPPLLQKTILMLQTKMYSILMNLDFGCPVFGSNLAPSPLPNIFKFSVTFFFFFVG